MPAEQALQGFTVQSWGLQVPMPWSTEHTVSLARALHRAAHLCKQQPHLVTPMIKVSYFTCIGWYFSC